MRKNMQYSWEIIYQLLRRVDKNLEHQDEVEQIVEKALKHHVIDHYIEILKETILLKEITFNEAKTILENMIKD